ncbi:MAG: hypothetical protein JSW67_07030 [Candidatus Latescibacterota bacterium]|nr:MAG: hypothetical protein JSW67_07030 [Candidatus Latescibacterota bacterium]
MLAVAAILVVAVLGVLLLWERDPAPLDDIEIMKREVEEAIRRSEADVYAPTEAAALRDSLATIEQLVQEQSGRLPFFRDYDEVRQRMRRLDQAVVEMEEQARRNKENIEQDVAALIEQAIALANEVDEELANAPRGKEGGIAIRDVRGGLRQVRQRIGEAQSALRDRFFVSARDAVLDAIDQATQLLDELRRAIEEYRAMQEADSAG